MGHQVNFYATPADIAEIEAKVRSLEAMVVLHDRSPTAAPRVLPSLAFEENAQPLLFYFLARTKDLSEVVTEHVPAQGYWTVDALRSPVVEFTGCHFDGNVLRRGRVYYVDGFFAANAAWVDKPDSFRTWAREVLKTAKKTLKKHGTDYIGKDASAWLQREHGKLVT